MEEEKPKEKLNREQYIKLHREEKKGCKGKKSVKLLDGFLIEKKGKRLKLK